MLVVCMVGVPGIQEVKFWIVDFVLLDPVLEFCSVSGHKTGSFVDNISHLRHERKTIIDTLVTVAFFTPVFNKDLF